MGLAKVSSSSTLLFLRMFSSWKFPLPKYCGCFDCLACTTFLLPPPSSIHCCEFQSWGEMPDADSNGDGSPLFLSRAAGWAAEASCYPCSRLCWSQGTCSGSNSQQLTSLQPCQLWQGPGASDGVVTQTPLPWARQGHSDSRPWMASTVEHFLSVAHMHQHPLLLQRVVCARFQQGLNTHMLVYVLSNSEEGAHRTDSIFSQVEEPKQTCKLVVLSSLSLSARYCTPENAIIKAQNWV